MAGSLIVGSTGRIEGDVEADSIIIGGEINGDVTVQGKAELTATARVIGDIRTSLIVIDEKAVFQGKCDMNIATGKTKNAPQNRLKQAKIRQGSFAGSSFGSIRRKAGRRSSYYIRGCGCSRKEGQNRRYGIEKRLLHLMQQPLLIHSVHWRKPGNLLLLHPSEHHFITVVSVV